MKVIRGLYNLKEEHCHCVLTIGNYDGLHLGHQQLLKRVKEKANQLDLPSVVMIFEPHPNEYFLGDQAPPRLMRFREKIRAFSTFGIDQVLCLRFDNKLANTTADKFLEQIIHRQLHPNYIVVGDDFTFGLNRRGDFRLLKEYASQYHYQIESLSTLKMDGQRVSSTRIRDLLKAGKLENAQKLLGKPYTLSGRVIHGDKRGRGWGFPTANIYLHRHASPVIGIFAVKVQGVNSTSTYGVAYVGTRAALGGTRVLLEVYLFDFDEDIYGRHIEVEFIHKIRDDKRFDTFDALKQQIAKDVEDARKFFLSLI